MNINYRSNKKDSLAKITYLTVKLQLIMEAKS